MIKCGLTETKCQKAFLAHYFHTSEDDQCPWWSHLDIEIAIMAILMMQILLKKCAVIK